MAQTAVEWFFMTMNIRGFLPNEEVVECYGKAKQMMEEQIRHAYNTGWDNAESYAEVSTDQYYQETFGEKS